MYWCWPTSILPGRAWRKRDPSPMLDRVGLLVEKRSLLAWQQATQPQMGTFLGLQWLQLVSSFLLLSNAICMMPMYDSDIIKGNLEVKFPLPVTSWVSHRFFHGVFFVNSAAEAVAALLWLPHSHITCPAQALDEGGSKKSADYTRGRNLHLDTIHLLHFASALRWKHLQGHSWAFCQRRGCLCYAERTNSHQFLLMFQVFLKTKSSLPDCATTLWPRCASGGFIMVLLDGNSWTVLLSAACQRAAKRGSSLLSWQLLDRPCEPRVLDDLSAFCMACRGALCLGWWLSHDFVMRWKYFWTIRRYFGIGRDIFEILRVCAGMHGFQKILARTKISWGQWPIHMFANYSLPTKLLSRSSLLYSRLLWKIVGICKNHLG